MKTISLEFSGKFELDNEKLRNFGKDAIKTSSGIVAYGSGGNERNNSLDKQGRNRIEYQLILTHAKRVSWIRVLNTFNLDFI